MKGGGGREEDNEPDRSVSTETQDAAVDFPRLCRPILFGNHCGNTEESHDK